MNVIAGMAYNNYTQARMIEVEKLAEDGDLDMAEALNDVCGAYWRIRQFGGRPVLFRWCGDHGWLVCAN